MKSELIIISNVPTKPVTIKRLFEGAASPALGNSGRAGSGVGVGAATTAALVV